MQRSLAILSLAVATLSLGACASHGPSAITKVKITRVNPENIYRGVDPAISFEQRHHLHGALTTQDLKDRSGNYYAIMWQVEGTEPVNIVFDYTQSATGSKILTKSEAIPNPSGSGTTHFQITGADYLLPTGGKNAVTSWRAQVRRGATVLAEQKSYLWK